MAVPDVPVSSLDGVTLTLEPTGDIRAQASAAEIGQGIQQGLAQIIADATGVTVEQVRVSLGDTAASPHGGGAWSSRGASITGEAAWGAGQKLRQEVLTVAACDAADDVGCARPARRPDHEPRLRRRSTRHRRDRPYGYLPSLRTAAGRAAPTDSVADFGRNTDPFLPTNGIQASLVEIDPASGLVRPLRHWVVEDCGRIINPLLVDEQIRGGVVQGIGEALYEECRYTDEGQFGSGTLADYLVPMAAEMPDIAVAHVETPYSGTVLGAKGAGEAGTCGAPAAVLNAVNDALATFGGRDRRPADIAGSGAARARVTAGGRYAMKPTRFQYACPKTLPEALRLLSQHNGDAAVLAGGQSLMPMLNLRVAQPAILIDINRVPELDAITCAGSVLSIGARARHNDVLRSPMVKKNAPLLAQALELVAHEVHPQPRHAWR